jgi:excinuclease ABC subunit A
MDETPHPTAGESDLIIRGARTHNLKNIDLSLPTGKLVVITGVSGSGKSSLAFDTIYAEGQRRYVESLSAYARQFLERMEKPEVDRIDGIAPAIAIRQKNTVRNPRSTVGTTTEIHDYMRLLYARVGRTFCRSCGREVVRETAEVVAHQLSDLPPGARLLVGFDLPVVGASDSQDADAGEGQDEVHERENGEGAAASGDTDVEGAQNSLASTMEVLRRKGFRRLLVGGRAVALEDIDPTGLDDRSVLRVVVDRLEVGSQAADPSSSQADPQPGGPSAVVGTSSGDRSRDPLSTRASSNADALRQRLTDSVETAYVEGGGAAWALELPARASEVPTSSEEPSPARLSSPRLHLFSERFECRACGITYEDPQPRLFSFNNPFGACPTCHGFGNIIELDMGLVVPDPTKSIQQGAIEPWTRPHYRAQLAELKRAARRRRVRLDVPWEELTGDERRFVIEGDDGAVRARTGRPLPADDSVDSPERSRGAARERFNELTDDSSTLDDRPFDEPTADGNDVDDGEVEGRSEENAAPSRSGSRSSYDGIRGFFRRLERKKYKVHVRVVLSRYRGYLTCPDCGGARLRREARDVKIAGRTIDQVSALTVQRAEEFFGSLTLSEKEAAIAGRVHGEIRRRLSFLRDVGLEYLTLDRLSSTLSGGEAQRINLATSLGAALVGTLYVLDEPSIGLHPRDNLRLIAILQQLRDQGNSVLVVEHDAEMMRVADHIVDLGLGAGEQGGRVVYSGAFDGLLRESRSLTSKYLRRELVIPVPSIRHRGTGQRLRLLGASEHNLKNIDVAIPLNALTCVTGVSGSGKSTLVHDVLYAAVKRAKGGSERHVGAFRSLEGAELVTDVVLIDQSPIGRTPRSNPVTYLKAFDPIRELFAATKDARARGLTATHFSFNVPGGRCEACQGEGEVRVEMQFLADVFVPCDQCDGKRFKPQVLEVRYRGRSIHQVLDLTVREALTFFSSSPKVVRRLQVLDEIGLGYVRLGQPAPTLSGGEAQRIKIAAHLSSHTGDRLLYILDEPTTGLHFDDIAKLLTAFRKLVVAGHTLVVIEHNLDVIKTADYVIDLGPEGGDAGGWIVAAGTPEEIAQVDSSHTGRYLHPTLVAGRARALTADR